MARLPVTLASGFNLPDGVAVDGSGNLFVTNYGTGVVNEIPVNGGAVMTVGPAYGYGNIFSVAVDNANNVYVTDFSNNTVVKVQPTGELLYQPAVTEGTKL